MSDRGSLREERGKDQSGRSNMNGVKGTRKVVVDNTEAESSLPSSNDSKLVSKYVLAL
jgi:hypothetical protein